MGPAWDLRHSVVLSVVPQWAWKMLWSANSIGDESVDEDGSVVMLL